MELRAAELIAGHIDGDVSVRESYSGRGMFGEQTAAIVADDFPAVLAAVARAMREADDEDADAILAAAESIRWDSMGREIVVY